MLNNTLSQNQLRTLLLCTLMCVGVFAHSEESKGELDLIAPTIEVTPIEEARPNTNLVISAKVKDNRSVDKVTFFYRSATEKNYKRIDMTRGGNGNVYFVSLERALVRAPSIAYYIQASDKVGNSVMYGYNFSPKLIHIHTAARANNSDIKLDSLSEASPKQAKANNGAMKWLMIGLGAVAVGALASGGGGGSGGDTGLPGDDDSDTGSVTIVAPVP